MSSRVPSGTWGAETVPDPIGRFATNLRARRTARGLSQEAVAAAAAMDPSQYGRIERGRVDPGLRTVMRIARALDTTPSELLRGIH